MFYDNQDSEQQENYNRMLIIIGSLSRLFSESDSPYIPYRIQENIFCKYFHATNLSRSDCSADAKKDKIGIGLKTWTGRDDQKIAEFGKLLEEYEDLSGMDLIKKISLYRNERIKFTKNSNGIDTMIYHIIKRIPNKIQIIELPFDYIDIDNITIDNNRGNSNNTYFSDDKHTYHFSKSKNTLYMLFENYKKLDEFEIEIMQDPYAYLMSFDFDQLEPFSDDNNDEDLHDELCLPLYSHSSKKGNFVPEKSGLNQWNAKGRKRNFNEIYIPYNKKYRNRSIGFFPQPEESFEIELPDGSVINARLCQSEGKAIMSNPNSALGEWLLRKVLELEEGKIITYEMLKIIGVDCVIFIKISQYKYKMDFSEQEKYYEDKELEPIY